MMIDDVYKPKSDKEWQAENDANTLARANLITSDAERLSAAQDAAAQMAEKEKEEAAAMTKVAKGQKTRPAREGTGQSPSRDFNVFEKI